MKRRMFLSVLAVALGVTNCAPVRAQSCKQWTDALFQSFLPSQTDDKALRELSSLAPEQYSEFALSIEKTAIQQVVTNVVSMSGAEEQMRVTLERFYAVGNQLYGTRPSVNDLAIISNLDPNAFATGSAIFIH